ncbi:LysR family transcriptional regulator [Liquorilactobacillus mali]|uniref:LysR family transcriptional regulator n=1 Tax=Liquorilactobacillus mali TaxID=1618 RepID=UPI00234FBDA2|nr:LysR family transcriptional regulator [Liquorilactobacillus mali]MDC7952200.1 LysR family transcriptional regulator [Liquorilactobacillus mali]MDV7756871.1 LysR family transcriptional regulator [Liquorilactobacillus mali]
MNISDLQSFIAVYHLRSISSAALELNMTQAALSKRMKALQCDLQIQLINTENRRQLVITEAGDLFYQYAKEAILRYDKLQLDLNDYRRMNTGVIKLGIIPVLAQYGITQLIGQFKQKHPSFNFHIIENEGVNLLSSLTEGKIDASILRDTQSNLLQDSLYHKIPLVNDELVVVVPASHPLTRKAKLKPQDLANLELVTLLKGSGVYEPVITRFKSCGIEPHVFFESAHIETIIEMINHSQRATFLFKKSAEPFVTPAFEMRSFSPPIHSQLQFVYPKATRLMSIGEFAKQLRQLFQYKITSEQENI